MKLWLLGGALFAMTALAQVTPDRELEVVKQNYNVGKYSEALQRARDAMQATNFNEAQRIELHKYAGLSAFNLGDAPGAEKHFYALLQLNPDYVLDPFAVPPSTIRAFEDVKKKNADALNLIRQQIALREDQARRDAAERERQRVAAEEARRRAEEMANTVTEKKIEKRSFGVNFVPFGVGQFQQGRTSIGILIASSAAAALVTSIIAYIAYLALFETRTDSYPSGSVLDGPTQRTQTGIPPNRRTEAVTWQRVSLGANIALGAISIAGVVDAVLHHQDEVVTIEQKRLEPPAAAPSPKITLSITPSGGFGAGITFGF